MWNGSSGNASNLFDYGPTFFHRHAEHYERERPAARKRKPVDQSPYDHEDLFYLKAIDFCVQGGIF